MGEEHGRRGEGRGHDEAHCVMCLLVDEDVSLRSTERKTWKLNSRKQIFFFLLGFRLF